MKEKIKKLRSEGKSYREIQKILGCSKSTISYHCSEGQKEKNLARTAKKRSNQHPATRKVEAFKARRALKAKTEHFQCRVSIDSPLREFGKPRTSMKNINLTFTANDVMNKFGENPKCNLTGRPINWEDSSTYCFDHYIPVSRGGENTLDNLNLVCPQANKAKSDLLITGFLSLCREVLENHGYGITPPPLAERDIKLKNFNSHTCQLNPKA